MKNLPQSVWMLYKLYYPPKCIRQQSLRQNTQLAFLQSMRSPNIPKNMIRVKGFVPMQTNCNVVHTEIVQNNLSFISFWKVLQLYSIILAATTANANSIAIFIYLFILLTCDTFNTALRNSIIMGCQSEYNAYKYCNASYTEISLSLFFVCIK